MVKADFRIIEDAFAEGPASEIIVRNQSPRSRRH